MRKLLIASSNQGKIREIRKLFLDSGIEIVGLSDYPALKVVEEDGLTFKENALKKARVRAKETGELTLADDSGLVVDYLAGKPGIYSARFAGPNASDLDNNLKLLKELDGVSEKQRTAHFECVAALVDPVSDENYTVNGICNGIILKEPRGSNGFGYDPLFFVPEYKKTMAELPIKVKNRISHRAKALNKMKKIIKDKYKELI